MRKSIILAVFVFCVFSITLTFSVRTTLSRGLTAFSYAVLAGNGSRTNGNTDARDQSFSDAAGGIETMTESSYIGNGGIYSMNFQFLLDGTTGDISNAQDIWKPYSAPENDATYVKFENMSEADSALANPDQEDRADITKGALAASGKIFGGTATNSTYTNGPFVGLGFLFDGLGSAAAAGKGYQVTYDGPSGGAFIDPGTWNSSNVNVAETSYIDFKHSMVGGPTDITYMELSAGIGPQ